MSVTDINRLKQRFAYLGNPNTVARIAQEAHEQINGTVRPRSVPCKVCIVRYAFIDSFPAPWRQAGAHWGIIVDDAFYHFVVGSDALAPCAPRWASADSGEPIDISIAVGYTTVPCDLIRVTLRSIADHFGTLPLVQDTFLIHLSPGECLTVLFACGKGTAHTVYWHCIDFLRAAAIALCDGPIDVDAWDQVLRHEGDVRAGILAVRACPKTLAPLTTSNDADEILSAQIIASTLPRVFGRPHDNGSDSLSGSTAPRCVLS